MQMEFVPRKETIAAIFVLQQILKRHKMGERKLYMVLVRLKTFDRVSKEVGDLVGTEKRCNRKRSFAR